MHIPRRCIWCKRTEPEAVFTTESHALAKAVGNVVQVLPPGIVCDQCNQYYGSKIEPWLLDDPLFHTRAVMVGLVDPDDMNAFRSKMFDDRHPSVGQVIRNLHQDINLEGQRLKLGVDYTIRGTMVREYEPRHLMALADGCASSRWWISLVPSTLRQSISLEVSGTILSSKARLASRTGTSAMKDRRLITSFAL